MNFTKYFRSRWMRGFSLQTVGPNEARVLYDFLAGWAALFLTFVFNAFFIGAPFGLKLFLLPFLLLAFNAAVGIYSYLKTTVGKKKAAILLIALLLICGTALLIGIPSSLVILWGFIISGPLVLPRIIFGLPYGRHKNIVKRVVNEKGPVLVVGGAGYIGTHVVDLLLKEGKSVRVLDRLMYGKDSLSDFLNHRFFELVEGDATDISKLTSAMKDVSAVVHLGGLVGDPACSVDAHFTRHTNIIATKMVKEVAQSLGIYRLVFASSCSVYGASDNEVREGDPLNPVSLYAQTKIDSERELLFSVPDDFFVTILRFATVFGHSRRPRFDLVANLFTAQAMIDGLIHVVGPGQWRPFIHVHDLARAVVVVLNANPVMIQGQIFNVGDKRLNMTIGQLGEEVKNIVSGFREVQMDVQENVADRRNYAVSFEKIRSSLGFEAEIMLKKGIEEMVDHFTKGTYGNYRDNIYHNLAITKDELDKFLDPASTNTLYAPLGERY
jgi:nucleoside-diphosphate-sugar epimerase